MIFSSNVAYDMYMYIVPGAYEGKECTSGIIEK